VVPPPRQLREDPPALRYQGDPRPCDPFGRETADRAAGETNVAAGRTDDAHDRVEGRALARAVWADEADDLAPSDAEAEIANCRDAVVGDLEPLELRRHASEPREPVSHRGRSPRPCHRDTQPPRRGCP